LLHLGTNDSSRVEGAHRHLKCYIKARNYDLRQTWKKIKTCVNSQVRDLAIEDKHSWIRKLASINSNPLYKPIYKKVTRRGFVFMEEQRYLKDSNQDTQPECTSVCTKTIGLPCGHILRQRAAANQPIQLSDIHQHWHID